VDFPRADVYRNLNKKCVSIRLAGRVVASPARAIVTDVVFRVQPGTLASIRRAGQRAVCAYARGDAQIVDSLDSVTSDPQALRLHFNPFKADTFTLPDGTPVYGARVMAMDMVSAWVIGPVTSLEG
jgi:hypothetical protein